MKIINTKKYNSKGFTPSLENGTSQDFSKSRSTYSGFLPISFFLSNSQFLRKKSVPFFSAGFTLIEVMVSVAIFTSIMILAIGALLTSNKEYRRTNQIRSSMDTMGYIVEDMSRNIRLGSTIRCEEGFSYPEAGVYPPSFSAPMSDADTETNPDSCDTGDGNWGITIEPFEGDTTTPSDQISYRIVRKGDDAMIYKSDNGGDVYYPLTPETVIIDPYQSGFRIFGTGEDAMQPMVVISISGKVMYKETETPFSFQTTVSQRQLDYEIGG